ncbi:transposable element Tc1 transposase [Trichonephila clavipes]|nr:transposable element Tc1 transposase [Trichonephila clavipes]
MLTRRNKEKFQKLTEFKRSKIFYLREGGFSYRTIGPRIQRISSTVMRVSKQWTDEHRTTRKTCSGRWKVTSARDDRHLLLMAVNDRTASSRQLVARWSTATGVLMSASSIRRYESRSNLWDHDGRIRVRRYGGELCLPERVIERYSGLTPGVMGWGVISYHGRCNLLRIESNLNSNRYVREVLQPEVVPFLQDNPGAIFQQDNARPQVAETVRDFCSAQHMQLLPWPAYSPDMLPIKHVRDLVGWIVIRVLQLQKTNFCCSYKQYGILFHKQNSINLKYEAISVPQGSVRLVNKTQERKSSTCYLLITKGVTSWSPVSLKIRRVGKRCTLNLSRAQTSSCWSGEVVKSGQLKYRPRHLTMVKKYEVRLQKPSCT